MTSQFNREWFILLLLTSVEFNCKVVTLELLANFSHVTGMKVFLAFGQVDWKIPMFMTVLHVIVSTTYREWREVPKCYIIPESLLYITKCCFALASRGVKRSHPLADLPVPASPSPPSPQGGYSSGSRASAIPGN